MISQAHKQQLQLKYGLSEAVIASLEQAEEIISLSPSEVREHLSRPDIDSSGFLLKYPGNGAFTVRLDTPHPNGDSKPQKYLRKAGDPNHLFNPGADLLQAKELWIVEGELKSLCVHAQGLPIVGLSGVWNWRTETEEASLLADGEKLKDEAALLPELAQVDWSGKRIHLVYDSDLVPGHKAYDAFPRLAEQLYRLGAEEVRILTIPSLSKKEKTGLDEYLIAKGSQGLEDLLKIRDRAEPYLPIRSGAVRYAERLIKSQDLEDQLKATVAYLGAKKKVFAQEWLKEHGLRGETRSALLQEAQSRLSQLQDQAKPRVSSQGDLPELGPAYNTPKALLRDHLDSYDIDGQGRLGKVVWEEISSGVKRCISPLCNFVTWPVRDILKDDGLSTERFIEFQGILQGGTSFHPVKISRPVSPEPTWPTW